MGTTRRDFVGTMVASAAGLAMRTAKSYAQIAGANERVRFAVMGVNSRGYAHLSSIRANHDHAVLAAACDVDKIVLEKFIGQATTVMGTAPRGEQDFRRLLAAKDIDAITIATPDHWHTPMAILALEAGKHVYVEKPCSHNPQEGAMLVAAVQKYGKVCQMGSQQRSSPHTIEIVGKLHDGVIGRTYWAETWYTNKRNPTGIGKAAAVPATLDWELWQGPAVREAYRENIHPYTWHWFTNWGTGEALNNGTHEVDIARWALGVNYPKMVSATGGRFVAGEKWQFYDTMDTSFVYPDHLITWKGDCCSGKKTYNRDRGTAIHGTEGTVIVDRDGYEVYDRSDKKTGEFRAKQQATSSSDLVGADSMTDAHFANFIAAIRVGEALRQPIAQGNVAVTMLQMSNIAYFTGRNLVLDGAGAIQHDQEAEAMTRRQYARGWEPKV